MLHYVCKLYVSHDINTITLQLEYYNILEATCVSA